MHEELLRPAKPAPGFRGGPVAPLPTFRVLGPVEVTDGTRSVPIGGRQQRRLLCALLVNANEVVSSDRLIDVLWGAQAPDNAPETLQTYVSRLRKATGALPRMGEDGPPLATSAPGYVLRIREAEVDSDRFQQLVDDARRQPPAQALARLDEGLAMWRGPAYAEFADEDFARPEAVRLEELRLTAVEQRLEARLSLGAAPELVGELETLVVEDPLRERPCALLMVALYRSGRQVDALAAYGRLKHRLAEEFGLEPAPALRQLEQDILQQAPALDAPHPPGTVFPTVATLTRLSEPASGPPAALPGATTSFVGREHELVRLKELFGEARIVTLTGPGGVGKSRLAIELSSRLADTYQNRTWFCELARIADPEATDHSIATTLGVGTFSGADPASAIIDFLRTKRALLVLDNCEHLMEAVVPLLESVIRRCPSVSVLATSRARLGVAGERVWPLVPLQVPEASDGLSVESALEASAVELFVERGQALRPGFGLTGGNAAAIAEICRRLDGLPLAIELAAACISSMNPADILMRLNERFRLLRGGTRAAEIRHQTLESVVDWSHHLLDDTERGVFARLAVFPGEFALDAAERICSAGMLPSEVGEALRALVDMSMVVADGTGAEVRYHLLETIRQYGRERLSEGGGMEATCRRHAEYFVALAEEAEPHLRGEHEGRWVRILEREIDNLRAAHSWAVASDDAELALRLSAAIHRYPYFRLQDEVLAWAERALDVPRSEQHPLFASVCGSAGARAVVWGDRDRAIAYAKRGLATTKGSDDPAGINSLEVLARVGLFEGSLRDCLRHSKKIERLARASGDLTQTAHAMLFQVIAHGYSGDTAQALALSEDHLRLAKSVGNPSEIAWALYARGEILTDQDPDYALELLEKSIETARSVGNEYVAGVALVSVASLQARHGEADSALGSFRTIIGHWHDAGDWTHQWTTIRNLIELFARLGAHEAAATLYGATTTAATAQPVFGEGEQRLTELVRLLEDRLGSQSLGAAMARGRDMMDEEAIVFARAQIDDVLARGN